MLSPPAASAQHLSRVGQGWSSTSVNTAVFRNNSIVTHRAHQYACYYDQDGRLTLARRKLGSDEWTVHTTQYRGNVADGHNVASMMVDGEGYLHLSFDHHGHPLHYCRSAAPESLELGELEPMVGRDEQDVTYPEFYRLKDGSLIFAYRSGASGRGNLVMNRYDIHSRRWTRLHDVLIDGEQQRNAYWQLFVDQRGVIHLSWVWRETWMVETNHDLCYARSADGGRTWTRADGTPYALPITMSTAEVAWHIPQKSELINQTSMSADARSHPFIATYWRAEGSQVPQYRLVWHDGHEWKMRQVGQRRKPFSLAGGGTKMIPMARPRMVVDGRRAYYLFRDVERGSRVSMYTTDNLTSGQWTATDLTPFSVDAWEPSLDSELWKRRKKLHIYVQTTHQGDGERAVESQPTDVYVLEINPKINH